MSRSLSFEQLEKKRSPTSLLLAVANLAEEDQVAVESWLAADGHRAMESAWRFRHDTEELLRFVEQNTDPAATPFTWDLPTVGQCELADTSLRLEEVDMRTVIICESMHLSRTSRT